MRNTIKKTYEEEVEESLPLSMDIDVEIEVFREHVYPKLKAMSLHEITAFAYWKMNKVEQILLDISNDTETIVLKTEDS